MRSLWTVLSVLVLPYVADAQDRTLWQIGRPDGSAGEFALYEDYRKFGDRWPSGMILYDAARGTSHDVPYLLPGPADAAWSRAEGGCLVVRFGADAEAPARLHVGLAASHPDAPATLEVRLNDCVERVEVPRGSDANYPDTHRGTAEALSLAVDLPFGALRAGENLLSVRNVSGSWVAWDCIRLATSADVSQRPLSSAVSLLAVEPQPVLVRGAGDTLLQPLRLTLANWTDAPLAAELRADGRRTGGATLVRGANVVEMRVPECDTATLTDVALYCEGEELCRRTVRREPVRKWTVCLVQHTHTDIGYTRPQTEILAEHLRYIDYAVEYCELTEDYPDDAKFRWTCEASWAVGEYLRTRPTAQVEKFRRYVQQGRIEVTAMHFNMAEILDEGSMRKFFQPLKACRAWDLPVCTAMQNDVNGIAWSLAEHLPSLGVKYVWMGEHAHKAFVPFDRPTLFRWESPSGQSVLAYRGEHYMTGNFWGLETGDAGRFGPAMLDYLADLERRGYPFDAVGIQYSGYYTDNSPPSYRVCEAIARWNETYAYPRLRSALPREFMEYAARMGGDSLPVRRAAYPDWWTDGFGSAARETGAARTTHADIVSAEGLLSMAVAGGHSLPEGVADEVERVHEELLFYDEHTFGASESLTDPMCWNSQVQWAEKSAYVWSALKRVRLLYEAGAGLLQRDLRRGERPTITLFNTLGWARSGMAEVYVDYEIIPRDSSFRIVDEAGHALSVQPLVSRNEGRYYRIYADSLPPLGYRTYEIIVGGDVPAAPSGSAAEPCVLENGYYRLVLDPATGAVRSLVDKSSGEELVDAEAGWGLGAPIYERLSDRDQLVRMTVCRPERTGLSDVRISKGEDGPLYRSVKVWGRLPGCDPDFGVQIEIRLFHPTRRLEFAYALRRLPETDPSGIYVAFPFRPEEARLAFDVQGGTVYPGGNQLEGTSSAWNVMQNFVAVRNGHSQILLGSDAVPLVLLGNLLEGPFQYCKQYVRPHLFSWVMNNYWTTNFRASQEGEFRWSYALTTGSGSSDAQALRFGRETRTPLYARVMPAGKPNGRPVEYSALAVGGDNLLVTGCSLSAEKGCLLLNVREMNGCGGELRITDAEGRECPFERVNLLEEPLGGRVRSLDVRPYENLFVRVCL